MQVEHLVLTVSVDVAIDFDERASGMTHVMFDHHHARHVGGRKMGLAPPWSVEVRP